MLDVSSRFNTAAKSSVRQPLIRITADYTNVLYDPTVTSTIVTGVENRVSFLDQVTNDRFDTSYKFISCDGLNDLSGNYHPGPANSTLAAFTEIGLWFNEIGSATGTFTVNPSLEVTFKERPITNYKVSGDNKRGEYPVDFTVQFYSGATSVLLETITGNTETLYTKTLSSIITNIDKIVLTISKWSEPLTIVKLSELSFAVTEVYGMSDIVSCSVIEEREISNDNSIPVGNIAAGECSLTLVNTDRKFDANNTSSDLHSLIKPGVKIIVEIGFVTTIGNEYVNLFTGWSGGWNVPENGMTASFTARDKLDRLTKNKFTPSVVQENLSFYDWFELVLQDASLSITEYSIDETLQNAEYIIPVGWIDNVTHRQALTELSEGCGASVYMDRNNILRVQSVNHFLANKERVVVTYTDSDYTDKNNQPVYENIANIINVTTSPVKEVTGETVYQTVANAKETIEANTSTVFNIRFTKVPIKSPVISISPSVAGVSITSSTSYAWGSDITVQNTNSEEKEFSFLITGTVFEVDGKQMETVEDTDSVFENGQLKFNFPENVFLQNKNLAILIADTLLESFSDPEKDLTLVLDPGGNPALELGDKIEVIDRYQIKEYNLISNKFLIANGGLSVIHKGRFTGDVVIFIQQQAGITTVLFTKQNEDVAFLSQDERNAYVKQGGAFTGFLSQDGRNIYIGQ